MPNQFVIPVNFAIAVSVGLFALAITLVVIKYLRRRNCEDEMRRSYLDGQSHGLAGYRDGVKIGFQDVRNGFRDEKEDEPE